MRKIIHASDIHFGKVDTRVIDALLDSFKSIRPDIVVISGDLTQRARIKEFEAAQNLLMRLHEARIRNLTIPGNHDIKPLYTPISRLRDPFGLYKKMLGPLTVEQYVDDEVAILGVNTVRASRLKGGRIKKKDLMVAEEWFRNLPKDVTRIAVTHHPLDLPPEYPRRKLAKRAAKAVDALSKSSVDLYLSGHYHRSSALHTAHRYKKRPFAAVAVQAGTISTRERGEKQSFNVIHIDKALIIVETFTLNAHNFERVASHRFEFAEGRWASA